jgi:tRNA threonylcarbamoyladenosine biosynthesis protein TsaB
MKLLALETSGTLLSLALFEDSALLAQASAQAAMRQSESLAPLVDGLLKGRGWKAGQLQAVAVSLGPGSFTGLRTGLAFAKGLSFATGAKLLGVPTLEAWAEGAERAEVWLDARRGLVYRGSFASGRSLAEPSMMPLEEARALAGSSPVLGDIAPQPGLADAAKVGRLALKRLLAGESDDAGALEPIYLRRPEHEILWERHHGA